MPRKQQPLTIPLFRRLIRAIERAPIQRAEKERLTHFAVFVLFGQIMFVVYCVFNLITGDLLLASLIFVAITSLAFGWLLLCHLPLGLLVYRACALIYGGLILSMLVFGGESGSKSLWIFTFPPFIVLLVGKREGFLWSAILLAAALLLLLVPLPGVQPFPYAPEFIVRVASVYVVIAATSCWYEHFREYYRAEQEKEIHLLRSVIDGLPEAIRLDDEDGRPLLCNPAYLAMTGLTRDELFEEETLETPETPLDVDQCSVELRGQAGEISHLLMWRERQTNNLFDAAPANVRQQPAASPHARQGGPAEPPTPCPAEPASSSDRSPSASPQPATILFAEDDQMLRQVGIQMLASLGYQVLAAEDGKEAERLYRAHQQTIDLVLCDQWMPRLNGWQLLASLRSINPSVPLIMISGAASIQDTVLEQTEQPDAYLKKPYSMDVLQRTLQQLLQRGQTPTHHAPPADGNGCTRPHTDNA